jgi:hypothetical protein
MKSVFLWSLAAKPTPPAFAQRIHSRFAGLKLDELPIPERQTARAASLNLNKSS